MYNEYRDDVEFLLVYIKEAHALDSPSPTDFLAIEDPINLVERQEVCTACIDDLDIPIPAIVDRLDDQVNKDYGAQPDRLYLVGKDGKIAYAGTRRCGTGLRIALCQGRDQDRAAVQLCRQTTGGSCIR